MKIALDYDGTFTADEMMWYDVMSVFKEYGHEVFIVTMRNEDKDTIPEWDISFCPEVVYCDGRPKRKFCEDIGLHIDIWIDDTPEGIHLGSEFTPEMLKEWRNKNV